MATQYPIVLVHGIMLKDIKFFKAFGRIERLLRENGYTVSTAPTDGFGTMQTNAEQLKAHILAVLAETGCGKVNLIAHSKGGLDSRYMIEYLDMSGHVASLTSLCTPHRGSRIASRLDALPRVIKYPIASYLHAAYRIFGDRAPAVLEVCRQLSFDERGVPILTNASQSSELPHPNPYAGIFLQSYATTMTRSRDDFVMGIPHLFSRYLEKEDATDGLVSRESAIFGEFKGDCIEDSLSHTEIVDFMTTKKKKERIYAFYLSLACDLAAMGC